MIKIKNTLFYAKVKLCIMGWMTRQEMSWMETVSGISGLFSWSTVGIGQHRHFFVLSKLDQLVGKFVIMFIQIFQENIRSHSIATFSISHRKVLRCA